MSDAGDAAVVKYMYVYKTETKNIIYTRTRRTGAPVKYAATDLLKVACRATPGALRRRSVCRR